MAQGLRRLAASLESRSEARSGFSSAARDRIVASSPTPALSIVRTKSMSFSLPARRMCSSCLMFTGESPAKLPALPGRKDTAAGTAPAQALSLLPRIEKGLPDFRPFPLQDTLPFRDRRRGGLSQPPGARPPRPGKTRQRRIPFDGSGDNLRSGEASAVDFLVRLHGVSVAPRWLGSNGLQEAGPVGICVGRR